MLVVLADDFSGAAEIGGIANRFGLKTEIQMTFNANTDAELVVLDSDTRSLNETEAVKKMKDICLALKSSHRPIKLFKKVDSVMRGHLISEINVLQHHFRFERVLLLPANPGRGREIVDGHYFVNEIDLAKSVFATDPHFPVRTSDVSSIVKSQSPTLPYNHLKPGDKLPAAGLITGDVKSKEDLKKYVRASTPRDLCCGAAELFESYLENSGLTRRVESTNESNLAPYTLILNGSTVKNPADKELLDQLKIRQFALPGVVKENEFLLDQTESKQWYERIVQALNDTRIAAIMIDHPVQPEKKFTQIFLNQLIAMMHYITGSINMSTIHFCLTGGETASAIMRKMIPGITKVKQEVVSGVVTLITTDSAHNETYCTVKPGSYPWPASFLQELAEKRN
jgi:uncharacterized protein YgbK (DUF1537 family)